jgi:ornithine cyclodeaminase/alanine dehydrogenase-like protein (mu-crystallin family)
MTNPEFIPFAKGDEKLDWLGLTEAIEQAHSLPKAEISDTFLYRGKDTLLSRSAWIDGIGILVKSATIFPGNHDVGKPLIHGSVSVLNNDDGDLAAYLDFKLVTKWKTAGDSLLGALKLARPNSRKILIIGAGEVANNLRQAYGAGFPEAEFTIWNRTKSKAETLAAQFPNTTAANSSLQEAIAEADIITSATMVSEPVIKGEWLKPGQHVDLIGAYRPDMREADDEAMRRATVFVDSYDTTVEHIGELIKPIASGAILASDIPADYYNIADMRRTSDDQITLFKNGGGAHLDLMTSVYILQQWRDK